MTDKKCMTANELMAALRNFPEGAEVHVAGVPVTGVADGGEGRAAIEFGGAVEIAGLTGEASGTTDGAADKALEDDDAKAPLTPEEQAALDETERLKEPDPDATNEEAL